MNDSDRFAAIYDRIQLAWRQAVAETPVTPARYFRAVVSVLVPLERRIEELELKLTAQNAGASQHETTQT